MTKIQTPVQQALSERNAQQGYMPNSQNSQNSQSITNQSVSAGIVDTSKNVAKPIKKRHPSNNIGGDKKKIS